jgi:hypothetical protein
VIAIRESSFWAATLRLPVKSSSSRITAVLLSPIPRITNVIANHTKGSPILGRLRIWTLTLILASRRGTATGACQPLHASDPRNSPQFDPPGHLRTRQAFVESMARDRWPFPPRAGPRYIQFGRPDGSLRSGARRSGLPGGRSRLRPRMRGCSSGIAALGHCAVHFRIFRCIKPASATARLGGRLLAEVPIGSDGGYGSPFDFALSLLGSGCSGAAFSRSRRVIEMIGSLSFSERKSVHSFHLDPIQN